jgi:glycosyltransferase involved in cell wall biosynthesis
MRVLWLAPAQLPAVTGTASMAFGGWLEGLRSALERYEPDVELGVVSRGWITHEPLRSGNATYFSLPASGPRTRLGRAVSAWQNNVVSSEGVHRAVEIARHFRPDIVHLHGTEHYLGLAALQLETPCVATLQGIATVCESFMRDALPWSEIARSVPTPAFLEGWSTLHYYMGMKAAARVEARIIPNLQYFMGQTDWDRTVLKFLNPAADYFECSRALQADYYTTEWQGPSTRNATIVCVSSPMPYKGVDTLLEGVHLLRQVRRQRFHVRITGAFPGSNLWPMLSRLVRRLQLEDIVTWVGPLGAAEVAAELSRATLFVMPSHIENESNSLIEAMLVGVPCVVAAVGGVPSVVRDGVDAVLYHDSDPFALAGAMDRLLTNADLAHSLGEKARIHALEKFDPEACARRTRAVYEQVLALA